MAPKKKRGGKPASAPRKLRTRGTDPKRSTDEDVSESTPESETQSEEPEKVEQPEIKLHKKFGKFRALAEAEESKEATEEPIEDEDDKAEVSEITEDLQDLLIENIDADVLVDCVNEEVIGGEELPMEVDLDVTVGMTEIEKEAEMNDETDMTDNKYDETSDEKDLDDITKEISESDTMKQELKKISLDKLIPSRKSTRISLKTTKLKEMQASSRKSSTMDPNGKALRKKVKKLKQANEAESPPIETESNDADSEESSENKSEENEIESEEEEQETLVIKKTKKLNPNQKPGLKKKLVKNNGKPKVNVAKKMINLKIGIRGKQLVKKKKLKQDAAAAAAAKEAEDDENSIRRSNRIKTISNQKKTSKGKGLVKKEADSDTSNSGNTDEKGSSRESPQFVAPVANSEPDLKPVKVKSRWRRSSELEMNTAQSKTTVQPCEVSTTPPGTPDVENAKVDEEVEKRLKQFVHLKENQYLTERISCKEAKKMTCDCFLTDEEIKHGEYGCGEDCLNRLLMIECGNLCTVGDRCTNKRFQKGQFASCEAFKTDKKGLGIRASANIPYGEFILEYVGEVLDPDEFEDRATDYSKDKNRHYYFMSLRADAVIDATQKGNISRFINHSCDPNAETQKWTVNGELRIGFFSKRTILAGEEITFDYQFQRYGKEAQKCFCEASTCRGWLGEEPEEGEEDEEEEEQKQLPTVEIKVTTQISSEEVKTEESSEVKIKGGAVIMTPEPEKVESPQIKILRPRRKPRKDIFEDLDLDDEIESLQATGLKNQAHTLKLSRLMVRAKETVQRTRLLKLLKRGELPCRRLFLDYHGLRLLHGWMTDTQHLIQKDNKVEHLRLDILQTLAMLPIPNKTMLQDSKVLPTVEKWAVSEKPAVSPIDSESNSPKFEADGSVQTPMVTTEVASTKEETIVPNIEEPEEVEDDEFQIRKSVGMVINQKLTFKQFNPKNIAEEISSIFDDDAEVSSVASEEKEIKPAPVLNRPPKVNEYDIVEEILALAGKLLEEWSTLKEVFRIPKKERIEQMKEHEREADRRFKSLSLEQENLERKRDRYRTIHQQRPRSSDISSERSRKSVKNEERNIPLPQISKHERRKMFAMQVEQTELDRRRKQQEFWQQHVKNCMMMGTDPRFTAPYDPNRGYQCIWNPQIGQWQNYPMPVEHTLMFNQNVPMPHIPNIPYPYIPPPAPMPQPPRNLPLPGNPGMHGMPPQNPHPQVALEATILPNMNVPPPTTNLGVPPNIAQGMMPPNIAQPNMLPPIISQSNMMPPNISQSNMMPPNITQSNMMPPNINQPNIPQGMMPPNINQPNIPQGMMPPNINQPNMSQGMMPPNINQPNIPQSMMPLNINQPNIPQGMMPPNITQTNIMPPNITQTNIMPPSITQQPNIPQGMIPPSISQPNMPPVTLPQGMMPPIMSQPNMPPASMGTMPPMPNIPAMPNIPYKEEEDPLKVKFMGPIPPAAKLPPKWKCANDKFGRPYYYHIKIRKSQWEPPDLPPPPEEDYASDSTSSSDTSSLSSDSSSEDSDSDDIDDAALMLEIRNKFKRIEAQKKLEESKPPVDPILAALKIELEETALETCNASTELTPLETMLTIEDKIDKDILQDEDDMISSLDKRLIEELGLLKSGEPPQKKRRVGLVQEILISPRTEEDRLQFKEDVKKYKQNKDKLRKQKDLIFLQTKKQVKASGSTSGIENSGETPSISGSSSSSSSSITKVVKVSKKKVTIKTKLKEIEANSELSKKIKETFRSTMAGVMVGILNPYRKNDCKQGRITNTDDFKHLARKLTHFVMLKELKHCQKIEDLTCTDSVKQKAKEFVRKYMSKFGESYQRPTDDLDNY